MDADRLSDIEAFAASAVLEGKMLTRGRLYGRVIEACGGIGEGGRRGGGGGGGGG